MYGGTPIIILHTRNSFLHANEHDPIMSEQQICQFCTYTCICMSTDREHTYNRYLAYMYIHAYILECMTI